MSFPSGNFMSGSGRRPHKRDSYGNQTPPSSSGERAEEDMSREASPYWRCEICGTENWGGFFNCQICNQWNYNPTRGNVSVLRECVLVTGPSTAGDQQTAAAGDRKSPPLQRPPHFQGRMLRHREQWTLSLNEDPMLKALYRAGLFRGQIIAMATEQMVRCTQQRVATAADGPPQPTAGNSRQQQQLRIICTHQRVATAAGPQQQMETAGPPQPTAGDSQQKQLRHSSPDNDMMEMDV